MAIYVFVFFFFKQKTAYEIALVTGVQTCALPIYLTEQALCLRGCIQPPLDAFEQRKTDPGLGVGQQAADRRLRDMQHLRGAADRTRAHHRSEDLDLAKIQ